MPRDPHPFEATGYEIHWKRLMGARVQERQEQAKIDTTAGDILMEVLPHRFVPSDDEGKLGIAPTRQPCTASESSVGGRTTFVTPKRTIVLDTLGNNTGMAVDLIRTLVDLDNTLEDVERAVFRPTFFYYDTDHAVADLHELFFFFVSNDSQIVFERIALGRYEGSGFNPEFFKPAFDDDEPIWRSERYRLRARVRWWYRTFYEDTETGRLTAFRTDANLFHHVPEWRLRAESVELARQTVQELAAIRLWVIGTAMLLLALVLLQFWR